MIACQRRRYSRWRMLLSLAVVLGLVGHCELAPTSVDLTGNVRSLSSLSSSSSSSSSSPTSSAARRSQDVGSPSELAWQAWLLVDAQRGSQSGLDSASLLRRITPKSVFIAPALPACADGYMADTMGRCVKNINVDQQAHIDFLLQRLNAMYANSAAVSAAAAVSSGDQKQSSGPLQLSIPFASGTDYSQAGKVEHEDTGDSIRVPVVAPPQDAQSADDGEHAEAVVTVYEVKNDTALDEEETAYVQGSSGASADDKVAYADTGAGSAPSSSSSGGGQEQRIGEPLRLDVPFGSSAESQAAGSDHEDTGDETKPPVLVPLQVTRSPNDEKDSSSAGEEDDRRSTTKSDTVVRVAEFVDDANGTSLSEVVDYKIPIALKTLLNNSDLKLIKESGGEEHAELSNSTDVSPTLVLLLSPTKLPSTVATPDVDDLELVHNSTAGSVLAGNLTGNFTDKEIIGVSVPDSVLAHVYEDEEYDRTTDLPDEESAEGGEILKHGEAGMTFALKNPTRDDVDANDDDEADSNVSSEASIHGDRIMETTLLNVNTGGVRNSTESHNASQTENADDSEDRSEELFEPEKEHELPPQVVFSPQDTTMSTGSHGEKRSEPPKHEPLRLDDFKDVELVAAPSSSESLLYDPRPEDYSPRDSPADQHAMEDSNAFRESVSSPANPDRLHLLDITRSEIPLSNIRPVALNFGPNSGRVRFPDDSGTVRFPSNEANSIHNQRYKKREPYVPDRFDEQHAASSTENYRKPAYWFVPNASAQRQAPGPLFVRFLAKIPRAKDPAFYPVVDQSGAVHGDAFADRLHPNNRLLQPPPARTVSFYKEMSPQDVSRMFTRKFRTIGG